MVATTHPYTRRLGRSVPAIGRRFASLSTLLDRLCIHVIEIAAAGQLGADAETEIGRSTGARV